MEEMHNTYRRKAKESLAADNFCSIFVHELTAGQWQWCQVVQIGYVKDAAYILYVKDGLQIVGDRWFQIRKAVLMGEAQHIE